MPFGKLSVKINVLVDSDFVFNFSLYLSLPGKLDNLEKS